VFIAVVVEEAAIQEVEIHVQQVSAILLYKIIVVQVIAPTPVMAHVTPLSQLECLLDVLTIKLNVFK
jgi:hypothetical protein